WISTDGAPDGIGYCDGLFKVTIEGEQRGRVEQFLSVPREAEVCGPLVHDEYDSAFVAVQHPGEDGEWSDQHSQFPDYVDDTDVESGVAALPRPTVVQVIKGDGGSEPDPTDPPKDADADGADSNGSDDAGSADGTGANADAESSGKDVDADATGSAARAQDGAKEAAAAGAASSAGGDASSGGNGASGGASSSGGAGGDSGGGSGGSGSGGSGASGGASGGGSGGSGSDGGELPWTGTDSTLPLLGGGAGLLAAGGAMATAAHLRRKKAADAESAETAVDEPSGD